MFFFATLETAWSVSPSSTPRTPQVDSLSRIPTYIHVDPKSASPAITLANSAGTDINAFKTSSWNNKVRAGPKPAKRRLEEKEGDVSSFFFKLEQPAPPNQTPCFATKPVKICLAMFFGIRAPRLVCANTATKTPQTSDSSNEIVTSRREYRRSACFRSLCVSLFLFRSKRPRGWFFGFVSDSSRGAPPVRCGFVLPFVAVQVAFACPSGSRSAAYALSAKSSPASCIAPNDLPVGDTASSPSPVLHSPGKPKFSVNARAKRHAPLRVERISTPCMRAVGTGKSRARGEECERE